MAFDGCRIAVAMGANTVSSAVFQDHFFFANKWRQIRAISCATSVGSKYSIMPSQNHYYATNATQWDMCVAPARVNSSFADPTLGENSHDYVIYAAGQYGLRVIMPLTDNYD